MTAKGKKPKGWRPISVAMQKANHKKTVAKWKPVTVAVQKKRHAKAVHAKAVAKAHPHPKAKTHGAPLDADGVPCCSAQAVAECRRLALGVPYVDADVLALHEAAGGTEHTGTSILDALSAAHATVGESELLILGLKLPGRQRHAVVAHDGVWWSWGEPYEPRTDVVITEAWAVTW